MATAPKSGRGGGILSAPAPRTAQSWKVALGRKMLIGRFPGGGITSWRRAIFQNNAQNRHIQRPESIQKIKDAAEWIFY
jgi:hypothetical protein